MAAAAAQPLVPAIPEGVGNITAKTRRTTTNELQLRHLANWSLKSHANVLVLGVLTPFAGTLLLCALGSVWPIRLDYRALQDLNKLQGLGLPESSGDFIFFSQDEAVENGRIATFALRQLAFPAGSVLWLSLKERTTAPGNRGSVAVDSFGDAYAVSVGNDGGLQWRPASDVSKEARQQIESKYLIFDSEQTRDAFEQRWPFLRASAHSVVLSGAAVPSVALRRVTNEFTPARVLRIAAVLGTWVAAFLVIVQAPFCRAHRWVGLAAALFLALGLNIWLAYLCQWVSPALVRFSPAICSAALLVLAVLMARRRRTGEESGSASPDAAPSRITSALIVCAVVAYALLFLVRLDFDGDFFDNWLPQARFHYLLGQHDPAVVIAQGSIQAASYPPGYGIALSTIMWMAGMNPTTSFLPGPESSFAILIYRLLIFALNASLLLLLAAYLRTRVSWGVTLWILVAFMTMLLIPSTAGRHTAAETVLFPMLAASILLVARGQRSGEAGLTALGLLIGAAATLVKWEGTIIFLFAALPWLLSGFKITGPKVSARQVPQWMAALGVGLLPTLIWRATLRVRNEFFAAMTWSRLTSSIHLLPGLSASAARLMLDDGRILLLLALPFATVYQLRAAPSWTAVAIPISVIAFFAGWVVILLFSNVPPHHYVETSYPRLVMVPAFSAILYCADALIDFQAS